MIDDEENRGTTTKQRKSLSSKHINKKLIYIGIVLFTIIIICLSTNDTSMLIQVLFQYHEPSIRIFRSLFEIMLLLLCTAISIRVYVYYISSNIIQQLLFQSIYFQNSNDVDEEEEDEEEDGKEYAERKYEHGIFQPVNDDDIDDQNTKDDESPLKHEKSVALSTNVPLHVVDKEDDTTRASLHQLSVTILSMAFDLLLYTCITLILYLLSAIHTLQSSSSNLSNNGSIIVWIAKIAAPTFPLLLFMFCGLRCVQYYQKYKEFYTILSLTMYAPFYNVTFRDGMIVRSVYLSTIHTSSFSFSLLSRSTLN
jgi:hypothetical protein